MESNPLVSIVVVNFNGKKYLKDCFNSLLEGRYKNIEIIFVDNGSDDESLEFVKTNFPDIKTVGLGKNLGLSVASNAGASLANGKYLFFYNNDTIADEHLIEKLVNAMESDSNIGVAGCQTYTYDGRYLINAGVSCDILGYPYGKGEPFYVDAAIFIRRELFFKIGCFDEKMFLYGEDRDICWRCWLYGYKVVVVKGVKFYHDSACITKDIKEYRTSINKRFLSEFNSLRSILKNYSLAFIFFILPLYFFINLSEAFILFLRREFKVIAYAYLKSYTENIKNIRGTLQLRSKVQTERKISDFELISHMNKTIGKLRLFLAVGIPQFSEKIKYGTTQG